MKQRNRLMMAFLSVLLLFMAQAAWAQETTLKGTGKEDDPYQIGSVAEWDAFVKKANDSRLVHGKLTADVGPVKTMVETKYRQYWGGSFDGCGYTLTVDYNTKDDCAAPFKTADGARISNLHVAGTITTSGRNAGGYNR